MMEHLMDFPVRNPAAFSRLQCATPSMVVSALGAGLGGLNI